MTDEEVEKLILGIYLGQIDINSLPVNLYSTIVGEFADALATGFKSVKTAEEIALFESLYKNIQVFSGAKTANMILDFESMLVVDGKIVEFPVFQKQVLAKYNTYMKTWLKTEYNYTVEQSKAAKRWVGVWEDKDLFPLLEYVTVGDSRVRAEHKVLDGTVRPVKDSFWSTYYPPLSWNCRCTTKSYEAGDKTITEIMNKKSVTPPKIDKMFAFNSGKKGIIFSPLHPYFTELPEELESLAKFNFGLPIYKVNG